MIYADEICAGALLARSSGVKPKTSVDPSSSRFPFFWLMLNPPLSYGHPTLARSFSSRECGVSSFHISGGGGIAAPFKEPKNPSSCASIGEMGEGTDSGVDGSGARRGLGV